MPYGRNFCIFDDADQRVLGGMSQVATVVAYTFYFHNLAHSQASAGYVHSNLFMQKYMIPTNYRIALSKNQ